MKDSVFSKEVVQAAKNRNQRKELSRLKKIEQQRDKVVKREGVMPFEKRPKATQQKLSRLNRIASWLWDSLTARKR
jgi:hypothetical protein